MSGLEPFIASALASVGTAGATAGTAAAGTAAATTAGTAAATAGAIGAGAASAGELALLASASQGLTAAAGGSALTAGNVIAGTSALAGLAGAGAQLLSKPPSLDLPSAPTRDTARTEADARSAMLKRRGRAATLLTGAGGVSSNPTLGSPSLTGTA
jgi:hypothetical protein